jgi:hypothetical protein
VKRAIIGLALAFGLTASAAAQTVANGPYYATPSWDQTLPAAQRFIVLANFGQQAVLDRETGLVWERSPSEIMSIQSDMRLFCIDKVVGGRKGWRLPSIPELTSLIDPATTNPSLPPGHPFLNIKPAGTFDIFFSATVEAGNPDRVWAMSLTPSPVGSHVATTFKASSFRAWCVRGGMNADAY